MARFTVGIREAAMNIFGWGTMICARNAGVDTSAAHVATKWITALYFRLWPLATYRMQVVERSGVGVPFVGGVLTDKFVILEKLPWTSNAAHIIRSLLFTWGIVAFGIWTTLVK